MPFYYRRRTKLLSIAMEWQKIVQIFSKCSTFCFLFAFQQSSSFFLQKKASPNLFLVVRSLNFQVLKATWLVWCVSKCDKVFEPLPTDIIGGRNSGINNFIFASERLAKRSQNGRQFGQNSVQFQNIENHFIS